VIVLVTLLLQVGAVELPAITIDPCVVVDSQEVRRLASIEFASLPSAGSARSFHVVVDCGSDGPRLRLVDLTGRVTVERGIDLSAPEAGDRDARARELALAIAELFRHSQHDVAPEPRPATPAVTEALPPDVDVPSPWRLELGASAAADGFTAGELLFGADANLRVRLMHWFLGELRFGARQTRAVTLEQGSLAAQGLTASTGLAFDVAPHVSQFGLALGARAQLDWLRYEVKNEEGSSYADADVAAWSVQGSAKAFLSVAEPLVVTLDTGLGAAIHPVVIRENNLDLTGLRGLSLSVAVGLAAQF
jgi:hypothetical protein